MKLRLRPTRKTYIILFAVLFLYVGISAIVQWKVYRDIQEKAAQVKEDIEGTKLKKAELEHTLQYADTDAFIESMVRDKLGWVKKGETRYIEGE